MPRFIDLSGKVFGRLTVQKNLGQAKKYGPFLWECRCECGQIKVANGDLLRQGHTQSCGCLYREIAGTQRMRHGEGAQGKSSTEFRSWKAMRHRCNCPTASDWAYYGGMGVQVSPRWDLYENFLQDMGRKPGPSYTIDRVDPAGDYAPGNCVWATRKQQANNKRRHHRSKQDAPDA